jgi:hypothetical protein
LTKCKNLFTINVMKKFIGAAISFSSFLALAPRAFAADFHACPDAFANLCTFSSQPGDLIALVIRVILIVAIVVALFFLIWGGIKWITSGGDEKQVEAAKGHVVAAIVGLVIALAAFFIMQFIGGFFKVDLLNFNIPTIEAPQK